MNGLVRTALAIAAAGSAAHAGTGDNEWSTLDSEISGLASAMKPSQDNMAWSVLLRAVFSHSSDDIATGGGGSPDTSGFNFNDVDAAFWGAQGPYRWRLSADIDGLDNDAGQGFTGLGIEDAYIVWDCGGYFDAMMGQFKPHLLRSNSVDPEKQLFIDRPVIGSAFDRWDDGIGVSGTQEFFNWYFGLLDGENGHEKDHFYYLRGEYHLGTGAGEYEGAMGSSDQLNATIGLTAFHNDTNDDAVDGNGDGDRDNTSYILDVNGSISNVGFGFEVARLDDDEFITTSPDHSNVFDSSDGTGTPIPTPTSALVLFGDSMPWSVTGSYMLDAEWEFAGRYEDLDNDDGGGPGNTVISLGVNWYKSGGRWQAQYSIIDADDAFNDGNILEVGYAVGSTR